jgi:hypothetical protein
VNKALLASAILVSFTAAMATVVSSAENSDGTDDKELSADLELLQGSWELLHGNEGKGRPSTRSVKTIEGNKETLRRYSIQTGKLGHEHSVEFKLAKSGNVRVFTFYAVGGSPKNGMSYVYKVNQENFYDVPGLLHGDEYRNYQTATKVWHWKRVPGNKTDDAASKAENGD